jgi:transglutaminase-like putative cysteine protease
MAVLSILILLSGLSISADNVIQGILCNRKTSLNVAAAVTPEKYPDADTVLIDDTEYTRYNPDGTYVMIDDVYEKILTEKGRRDRSTLSFHFMVPFSTIEIDSLEVISPDGSVRAIDVAANSKVMVSPGQMNSNIYDPNVKIMTVGVPGLQVGDVLHYTWRRNAVKTRVPDTWCNYIALQSTSPIIRYQVMVDAPAERPLKKTMIKDEVKGSIDFTQTEKNGRIIYDWVAQNVPRIFEEPGMPAYYTVVQRLLVSTEESWEDISRWYWNLSKPRLDKTTPEMKAKVAELIKGLSTPEEKINAIFQFVSNRIRYMGITMEDDAPGYEPHDVSITFENRYGVCRDKAALLVAMLRIAGFEAFPVLMNNGPKKDKEVPNNYFNHAVVAVDMGEKDYILMDPTDESTRDILPSYLCNQSYLVARPDGDTLRTSDVAPVGNNLVKINTRGDISKDGVFSAATSMTFEGVNDTIYRGAFMRWTPERRFEFFARKIKEAVPGAELKTLRIFPEQLNDTNVPLRVEMTFSANGFPIDGTDMRMIKLPWIGTTFGAVNFVLSNTGLEKRRFPMKIFSTCGVEENFTITMRDPSEVLSIPEYKVIDNPDMFWKQSIEIKNGVLSGKGEFLLRTMEIMPAQYQVLKQSLRDMEYARRKMPVFKSDTLIAGADALILEQKVNFSLRPDGTIVKTERMKKRILTYAGIKKYSELKISYNPVWTELNLKYAKVTTPDGTVNAIKPEEINIMDAPWVSSAPRYPAEKVKVVALPRVDKNSIIEYEIEAIMRKRPFLAFIGTFQNDEPIKHKNITLSADKKLVAGLKFHKSKEVTQQDSATGDMIIHQWSSQNQPKIPDEGFLPPEWVYAPAVFVSNGDWKIYAENIKKALKKALNTSERCTAKARELTAKVNGDDEKIRIIRDYIDRSIRTAGPSFESLPLSSLSSPDRTLADGYGHSADKALVFYAMLTALGFQPEFALSMEVPDLPKLMDNIATYPQTGFIDEVLVKIIKDGAPLYFNCASQYARPGTCPDDGFPALMLNNGEFKAISVGKQLGNRFELLVDINIDENGAAEITRTVKYYGVEYERFNKTYSEMTPEQRRRYFQTEVNNISEAAVMMEKNVDLKSYPAVKTLKVKVPQFAVRDGKYLYFMLPLNIMEKIITTGSTRRSSPYYRSSFSRFEFSCNVNLPDNVKQAALLPSSFEWNYPGKGGTVSYEVKTGKDNGKINVRGNVNLKPALVSVREYPELLFAEELLERTSSRLIMVELK